MRNETIRTASLALEGMSDKAPVYGAVLAVLNDVLEDIAVELEDDIRIQGEQAILLRGSQNGLRILRRNLEGIRTGQILPEREPAAE